MKDHVLKLLESYRIGTLHPDDRVREEDVPKFESSAKNMHSKNLKVLQNSPFIAETQSKTLVSSFVTPNSEFFIRAHQATPTVSDPSKYKIKLLNITESAKKASGSSDQDEEEEPVLKLTINDLKSKFSPHKVMTAMSCAGNRRLGMKEHSADVQGNMWYVGAIGNAQYTGVLLIDLLKAMGLKPEELQGKHLIAESLDVDVQGKPFKVSIPMEMIIDPLNEVILAY
jgi:sulfite oxidase